MISALDSRIAELRRELREARELRLMLSARLDTEAQLRDLSDRINAFSSRVRREQQPRRLSGSAQE